MGTTFRPFRAGSVTSSAAYTSYPAANALPRVGGLACGNAALSMLTRKRSAGCGCSDVGMLAACSGALTSPAGVSLGAADADPSDVSVTCAESRRACFAAGSSEVAVAGGARVDMLWRNSARFDGGPKLARLRSGRGLFAATAAAVSTALAAGCGRGVAHGQGGRVRRWRCTTRPSILLIEAGEDGALAVQKHSAVDEIGSGRLVGSPSTTTLQLPCACLTQRRSRWAARPSPLTPTIM